MADRDPQIGRTTHGRVRVMSGLDGLLLPERSRIVHIGPHKTGTTAIQGAFAGARDQLGAYGLHYPGKKWQVYRQALALTGSAGHRATAIARVQIGDSARGKGGKALSQARGAWEPARWSISLKVDDAAKGIVTGPGPSVKVASSG